MSEYPAVGSPAPQFTAPVVGGEYGDESSLTLSDLAGETVVLYFYPRDGTPGCTMQACDLRDRWDLVSDKAKIFGVSTDSVASHQKFVKNRNLPFPLISDKDKKIVEAYGVWKEKSVFGKIGLGTERTTFIIDPEQNIQAVLAKVSPMKHIAKILEALGEKAS